MLPLVVVVLIVLYKLVKWGQARSLKEEVYEHTHDLESEEAAAEEIPKKFSKTKAASNRKKLDEFRNS